VRDPRIQGSNSACSKDGGTIAGIAAGTSSAEKESNQGRNGPILAFNFDFPLINAGCLQRIVL
jgi:hypothetical protein